MSITEKQAEVQPLIRNESLQASLSASSLCRPARAGTVKAGDGDASATIYYEVYSSRRAARKDGCAVASCCPQVGVALLLLLLSFRRVCLQEPERRAGHHDHG